MEKKEGKMMLQEPFICASSIKVCVIHRTLPMVGILLKVVQSNQAPYRRGNIIMDNTQMYRLLYSNFTFFLVSILSRLLLLCWYCVLCFRYWLLCDFKAEKWRKTEKTTKIHQVLHVMTSTTQSWRSSYP